MKKIFIACIFFTALFSANAAELFYSDGTSVPMKKSEELIAVKTKASDAENQKGAVYRMNTGKYVYSFVRGTGKKDGDALPVYYLGDEPVVAERTVLWRGEKPVEYMEKKYNMKLTEIFPTYPLYAFSVQGDSVEISEKIVKNGDGYAFADILRETTVNFVPENAPQDPYFGVQWHLQNTGTVKNYFNKNANILRNADTRFIQMLEFLNSNGIEADTNTKIAIMDTGVAPNHEDLTNLDIGYDALEHKDGGYPDENVSDNVDHGTQCAGISAAVGNTTGMSGMCPWCRIYPVRWLSGHGSTSHLSSDYLTVYEKYTADPDITTINCSFGPTYANTMVLAYPDTIEVIQSFMQNGRNGLGGVVVYSSGNDDVDSSYNRILDYEFKFERNGVQVTDKVVTVNASTAWDTRAEYSNFGYATTVAAPSRSQYPYTYVIGIATTAIPGYGDYKLSDEYTNTDYSLLFGGTSAAAPVVSGLFGVLFSINPDLTLEEAVDILKRSADKINPETGLWDENGFSVKFGYGRVNLEKAVRLAMNFPMCAETKVEECGNHLDDDCDGYVDEGCAEELKAGKSCENDADCLSGTLTLNDVSCLQTHEPWVFKNGYCVRKTHNNGPCPDGTQDFGAIDDYANQLCAIECNSSHPCQRAGYYCTDEVLGICVPLCSDSSYCTDGYSCNENGHCVPPCGNGILDEGEVCDYGENNGVMDCPYNEKSCKVCTADCQEEKDGKVSYCGDYITDPLYGEVCDRGYSNGKTNCTYGETSCTVCTSDCKEATGITSYCGDGTTNSSYETCDNASDNGRTDCVYGEHSCTVCTANCRTAAGATSYCGDGRVDGAHDEVCDAGSDNGRTNCAYGETECTVCTADCKTATGITSYCGDSRVDGANGEVCDAGADNGMITDCAYGETSCTVCTANCRTAAGATSYCGDGSVDGANGEVCDDGNNEDGDYCSADCKTVTGYCGDGTTQSNEQCDNASDNGTITDCTYGETSCTVCTADCRTAAGATSYCGDGSIDTANGEVCDRGFGNGETNCLYGETECTVCTTECQENKGITSFCGDGKIDTANGEICDDGDENGEVGHCNGTCSGIVEIPETPDEGDTVPDEGDTTPDEGDTVPDEGDTVPDEGDTVPDEDDTTPDEGDTTPDNGDTSDDNESADNGSVSSDDDAVETDDSSEEPSSGDSSASDENKEKSDGCSVLVI